MSYESEKRQINVVAVIILALSIVVAYLLYIAMQQKVKIEIAHNQITTMEKNMDLFSKTLERLEAKHNVYMDKDIPAPVSLDAMQAPDLSGMKTNLNELNGSLSVIDEMTKTLDELAVKALALEEAEARGEDVSAQMDEISAELKAMEQSMMEMTGMTQEDVDKMMSAEPEAAPVQAEETEEK